METRGLGPVLKREPESRVILETCAEAFSVADAVLGLGHEVRVVPATLVRSLGVGARGIKTDVRDARILSEVSCRIDLPSVHVPTELARERRSTCGMREELVASRTALVSCVRGWGRDRTPTGQAHRGCCGRAQARRCHVRTVARRHAVRSEPRQQKERCWDVVWRHLADQSLPVTRAGQRPNNGCPEAVSANDHEQVPVQSRRPRVFDCTPPTDFHLCATTSANSRFRQPVVWRPGQPPTGQCNFSRGRGTSSSLTVRPPHSW